MGRALCEFREKWNPINSIIYGYSYCVLILKQSSAPNDSPDRNGVFCAFIVCSRFCCTALIWSTGGPLLFRRGAVHSIAVHTNARPELINVIMMTSSLVFCVESDFAAGFIRALIKRWNYAVSLFSNCTQLRNDVKNCTAKWICLISMHSQWAQHHAYLHSAHSLPTTNHLMERPMKLITWIIFPGRKNMYFSSVNWFEGCASNKAKAFVLIFGTSSAADD